MLVTQDDSKAQTYSKEQNYALMNWMHELTGQLYTQYSQISPSWHVQQLHSHSANQYTIEDSLKCPKCPVATQWVYFYQLYKRLNGSPAYACIVYMHWLFICTNTHIIVYKMYNIYNASNFEAMHA